jgi:hypothetical protein
MAAGTRWIDLLDPSRDELQANLPADVHERALEQLLAPALHDDEPRPKLEPHDYVFGQLLVPVLAAAEEGVFYQEIDLAGVRDYHQAQIANEQNDVMKKLTAIASILLPPHADRRPVRAELPQHPRAALGLGLLLVARPDRDHLARPDPLLPPQELALTRLP